MNPTPPADRSAQGAAPVALVIEPSLSHLLAILSALAAVGFDTRVAESYLDARASLDTHRPTLLVTGLKLREYNGLQLVLRGTSTWPEMRSIVMADVVDPVLQTETERLGATFLTMPASQDELMAAISRTVLQETAGTPIRAPFERRTGERRRCATGADGDHPRVRERRRNVSDVLRSLV